MLCSDRPQVRQGWRASPFVFDALAQLVGNKAMARAPCPLCSPMRRPSNRKLPVLTIWRKAPDFLTYSCNPCLEKGWATDAYAKPVSRAEIKRRMREAEEHQVATEAKRRSKARWLWSQSVPIAVDDDAAGRRHAHNLARELRRLRGSSIEVGAIEFGEVACEAA